MNTRLLPRFGCRLALATGFVLAASSRADTPAFQGPLAFALNPNFSGTSGWQFNISTGFFVTQLGIFDAGSDGLGVSHEVGLWRVDSYSGTEQNATGTLLASATIPAGTAATLAFGYRWVSIKPVFIPTNTTGYMVGAFYPGGGGGDYALTSQPIAFARPPVYPNTYWGYTSANPLFEFPGQSNRPSDPENPFGRAFWEVNFQFSTVPEPSAWCLFLIGLLPWFLRSAGNRTRSLRRVAR